MKIRNLLCGLLILMAVLSFTACQKKEQQVAQTQAAPTVIRIGNSPVEHPDHPVTIGAYALKEYIEEKSNGRFDVRIFPGSQLGTNLQLFEMVQLGTLDISIVGIPQMAPFTDALAGMDMPYLFRGDYDLMYKALNGPAGRTLLADMEKDTGVKTLGYAFHVWLHFLMTKKPIRSLADCQGQKLRVIESPVQQDIARSFGFSPIALSLGELYQAMNQGTIDGITMDMIGGYTEKYPEVVNYLTKSAHLCFGNVIAMAEKTFSSLSPEDQKIFMDAGAYAEELTYRKCVELESVYEQKMKDSGVEIITIDLEPFYKAVQPMIDRYTAQSPRIKAFVDAVNAMR